MHNTLDVLANSETELLSRLTNVNLPSPKAFTVFHTLSQCCLLASRVSSTVMCQQSLAPQLHMLHFILLQGYIILIIYLRIQFVISKFKCYVVNGACNLTSTSLHSIK